LDASPDRGTFVGIVTLFFSGMLLFETDFPRLTFWVFLLMRFSVSFPGKGGLKDNTFIQ
jgi:hypothetical protein